MDRALIIFQALAEPTRLRILRLLREMELSVGELAQVLGQSQPRVSRHVKVLAEAELVVRRKEGSWVFLALGAEKDLQPIFSALDHWHPPESEDEDDLGRADRQRLQAVRNVRMGAAEDWFEVHAAEWDAIRSLHVSESEVEAGIRHIIGDAPIGSLVDIGTGTGRMLELLAGQCQHALGFDRSPSMLRLARAKLEHAQTASGEKINLRQGNFYALPIAENATDLAIIHQALRYAQHPAAVIIEAARILTPDGKLLVVDFASHQREELRMRDAHVYLGFSDQQMKDWFHSAGLDLVSTQALAGELTVKMWLGQLQSK
ncbi:metalloregulator ArsR/SmtB family transcription factor [Saccharibacter sp. 17.LH.SD]|uniref:ArsR/SmtB family transcription factor n=1 Tax=Saccharibacter sp. 17.LH.SD TaxID=2689393 RepID=UPI00136B48E3|nr:metalloregulator ArsR/SmtB family transcription factor [Saccharibacter sp. 17.LH.SD]MXV43742.1 metalloregulator ArsR/SmtB family transcription factor [Saccharibacter sp. 17.LH.SD]